MVLSRNLEKRKKNTHISNVKDLFHFPFYHSCHFIINKPFFFFLLRIECVSICSFDYNIRRFNVDKYEHSVV